MQRRPAIVAHRGASGYLPEHTLAAYDLGIAQGADAFEIDVVPTRDGHLIARHENNIAFSTDVGRHPEFADRRGARVVAGHPQHGWFTEDFTLAEIAALRAIEPLPGIRSTDHDGRYAVPALPEILARRAALAAEHGRPVGLKLEVKTPEYFTEAGLPMAESLIEALGDAHALGADSPVEIMSFDYGFLVRLRGLGVPNRLVFLVEEDLSAPVPGHPAWTYADAVSPAGLAEAAGHVDIIGPGRSVLFPGLPDGSLGSPTALFADAHAAGLRVDCWTFRAENLFLPTDFRVGDDPAGCGDLAGVVSAYVEAGLDTVITDHPDLVVAALGR